MRKLIQATVLGLALSLSLVTGSLTTEAATTSQLITEAKKHLGDPWVSGAESPGAFDCSGYTQYVYKQMGISLPRTADQQFRVGTSVSKANLQVGDLVFFNTTNVGAASHVGIYIGGGNMIGSASSTGVAIVSINDPWYWGKRYVGAKRVANFGSTETVQAAASTPTIDYSTRAEIAVAIANSLGLKATNKSGFGDVPSSASYADAVYALKEAGVVAGRGGNFYPNENVSRAEMAKMLNIAYSLKDLGKSVYFKDVAPGGYSEQHISNLAQNGITLGKGYQIYGVNDNVKEGELELFMERAAAYLK